MILLSACIRAVYRSRHQECFMFGLDLDYLPACDTAYACLGCGGG